MAGKLIPLQEAAEMLGISPDELTEMRSRGEIHGYRDGSSWKFKESELERVAGELGKDLSGGGESSSEAELDLADADMELADPLEGSSILVSEVSLGKSSGASSIIGGDDAKAGADSDIQLAPDSDIDLADESDLQLASSDLDLASSDIGLAEEAGVGSSGSLAGDSDVALAADEQGSDVKLVAGDSSDSFGSDVDFVTDSDVLADDSGEQKVGSGDTGRLGESSDLELESDAVELATGDSLSLGDDDLLMEGSNVGSSAASPGSSVAFDESEDEDEDDLVLSGSGIGSDVTLGPADSGIGLTNPSESGLDLEDETLDLGGSAVESLELPEDEDDDVIALEEETDPDAATQLKADDEFLLTPVEDAEDEEESGSQVIALEDSEAYDSDAATMLGGGAAVADEPLVAAEDSDMFGQQLAEAGAAPAPGQAGPMQAPMPMPMPMAAGPPEAPYSVFQVLSLLLATFLLLACGLLMFDLMNNLWEYQEVSQGSTLIMDTIIDAVGMGR